MPSRFTRRLVHKTLRCLERPPLLPKAPATDLVADPPFRILRPGAYAEGDSIRFVVHTPHAADVQLVGEWTEWLKRPVQMHATPRRNILVGIRQDCRIVWRAWTIMHRLSRRQVSVPLQSRERLQDPAAGWVETSRTSAASRLVNHDRFDWRHQLGSAEPRLLHHLHLHPSRFSSRFGSERPLRRVAREIADNAGYLRELGE